jgi:hypothetical protein
MDLYNVVAEVALQQEARSIRITGEVEITDARDVVMRDGYRLFGNLGIELIFGLSAIQPAPPVAALDVDFVVSLGLGESGPFTCARYHGYLKYNLAVGEIVYCSPMLCDHYLEISAVRGLAPETTPLARCLSWIVGDAEDTGVPSSEVS